jgi:hypothetical protein
VLAPWLDDEEVVVAILHGEGWRSSWWGGDRGRADTQRADGAALSPGHAGARGARGAGPWWWRPPQGAGIWASPICGDATA